MARQRSTIIKAFRAIPFWYREALLVPNRRYEKSNGYKVVIPMTKKFL